MVESFRRLILVRHGELALKSPRVRARLMRTLSRRIEEALERAGVEGLVEQIHSRHLVEVGDLERGVQSVSRVFGITSLSVAAVVPSDLSTLEEAAAEYARLHWPEGAKSFAVRARRTGTHPYSSQEAAAATGSAVFKAIESEGKEVRVDLGDPDWSLYVEVRNKQAFLHHDRVAGPGGLPLGSQGRLVVWLTDERSGVAAWLMMRRGAQIVPFYLPQVEPWLTGRRREQEEHPAWRVHEVLREWGAPKRLHELRLDGRTLKRMEEDPGDVVPLARAAMERGLDLARRMHAHAFVTPETRNVPWASRLPDVHPGGDVPTLRPLMGLDPETIERYMDRIGLRQIGEGRGPESPGLAAQGTQGGG